MWISRLYRANKLFIYFSCVHKPYPCDAPPCDGCRVRRELRIHQEVKPPPYLERSATDAVLIPTQIQNSHHAPLCVQVIGHPSFSKYLARPLRATPSSIWLSRHAAKLWKSRWNTIRREFRFHVKSTARRPSYRRPHPRDDGFGRSGDR